MTSDVFVLVSVSGVIDTAESLTIPIMVGVTSESLTLFSRAPI